MSEKKTFIATCIDILNTAGIFNNATELAQMIEASGDISARQFLNRCAVLPAHKEIKNKLYAYNFDYDIYWFYDNNKDIHYFYG